MKHNKRRVTLLLGGVAAGALLAATYLSTALAYADEYDLTPDTSTFLPTQADGYPPLFNAVTGPEDWSVTDLTTGSVVGVETDSIIGGTDTQTTIGSITNDDFYWGNYGGEEGLGSSGNYFDIVPGTQVDLTDFGGGFENEWVDVPVTGLPDSGTSDLLITPFGDFTLFGTAFSDLASAIASI